ncbi:uncharacterized protein LOC125238475 [Leguminivora glycinivorella]|uniref:uncharacterized protein LOC125238475 n=1 Tax=Leguminivora glycinivorella TaxID=1035111 RepID=UPI00200F5477|nr:uncharacterized protein LOC125238475 [Leguminivora glycinivorella]
MDKYSKNFILVGDLNHHCLLCKESFLSIDDLEKHLRWEKHRKSVKDLSPMPKFKRDRIFKIDDKYFCEHCNQILSTISEIQKHVQDEYHQKRKAEPEVELRTSLCKRESGITFIGKEKSSIKIPNKEWYGIIDSKCVFCDVAVDHFMKHVSCSDHMITMIQSKIVMNEEGLFYREFKDKGYCFLCKTTFQMQSKNEHWKDDLHMEKAREHNVKNSKSYQEKKLEVAIKLINTQKDYFDIDLENKVATCKICTAYVNINFKFMMDHKKIHNITDKDNIKPAPVDMEMVFKSLRIRRSKKEIYDHGKLRAELAKFGRENYIKLVFPGDKGYCSLCGTYMSAHMKNFTEHINGYVHMAQLDLKNGKPHVKPEYKTKNMKDFVKTVTFSKESHSLSLNKQVAIDVVSLGLVCKINNPQCEKFMCYACDKTYKITDYEKHCLSEMHRNNFYNSEIITSIEDEFIREVRPNVYHCGVCNIMFAFWDTLNKHFRSWKHRTVKGVIQDDFSYCKEVEELTWGQEGLLPKLVSLGFKRAFILPKQETNKA